MNAQFGQVGIIEVALITQLNVYIPPYLFDDLFGALEEVEEGCYELMRLIIESEQFKSHLLQDDSLLVDDDLSDLVGQFSGLEGHRIRIE